uniref:Uncharacterized protein n=1 Tax=Cacopsylla melanoneura TaxID=428564 RepID=A0A8D8LY28_9HEMI
MEFDLIELIYFLCCTILALFLESLETLNLCTFTVLTFKIREFPMIISIGNFQEQGLVSPISIGPSYYAKHHHCVSPKLKIWHEKNFIHFLHLHLAPRIVS